MKTRPCLSWQTVMLFCGLSFTSNLKAAQITFFPIVNAPPVDTSGDVLLVGTTGPNINLLADGFSLSRSYTVSAKNNGNGTAFWTASRDFQSSRNNGRGRSNLRRHQHLLRVGRHLVHSQRDHLRREQRQDYH